MADVKELSINGTVYSIKDATARSAISGLATVATTGDYDDLTDKPTIPDDISDLSDVSISSATNGQGLIYNSTTQKWENGTISGGTSTYDSTNERITWS